ncbi:MAG: EAL domain-containing protein [Candidatus Eremiobacteraeota bacterium]|nr:EAL domain-containing protein [Candidatus Eremiobacteraeota bacterium]
MAARLDIVKVGGTSTSGPKPVEAASAGFFTTMAETAALALGTPWASIVLGDGDRVEPTASYGFDFDPSFGHGDLADFVANLSEPFMVDDLAPSDRRAVAIGILGPAQARSFAGVPILGPGARRIGVLCVCARESLEMPVGHLKTLTALAELAARGLQNSAAQHEANAVRAELSALIDTCPVAITKLDLQGRVSAWSPAAERLSGYAAADVMGHFPPWVPGGKTNRDFRELLAAIRRGASHMKQRSRRTRADGTQVEIRVYAAPIFSDDGVVTGAVAMAENVEELDRAERRLHLFESAVSKASDAMFVTSSQPLEDPQIMWVNEAFVQMYGYETEEIVGKNVGYLSAATSNAKLTLKLARARRDRVATRGKMLYRRKNGQKFWCESTLSPVIEDDGRCENWVVIARDVTEQLREERLRNDSSEILEMIAADAPMERIFAALVTSAERARPGAGAVLRLRRADMLFGVAFGDAFDEPILSRDEALPLSDADDPCARAVVDAQQIVAGGDTARWSSPIRARTGDILGTFAMVATSAAPPTTADLNLGAEFARLAALAMERHEDREQLEFLALHDALTSLPNRKLLQRRLDAAIEAAGRRGRHVALGMIDLDRFKVINDSLGHAVGDQLLRDVAGRLAFSLRPGDTIARLGGDEFVLLIDDLPTRDDAIEIAERVLLALGPSFDCGGQEVFVRASMGLSTFPEDASDAESLLALGDAAMYDAKARGRDVAFHVHGDDRRGVARLALETSLNYALEKREFEVLYQPLVELRTRELRGGEALLRWHHPVHGLMLPDTFVRAAEDTGLIVPIGAWVLEEACRFAKQWQDEGLDRFVSVNVSARQFDRPEFVAMVTQTLETTGLEAGRLHLELTESLVMRSPEKAAATLAEFKTLGVKLVIDDFGTGYSSFNYLKRFPLDTLKIDRLFVRDIGFGNRAPSDEAIVRAIVGVARALDLKIVAEGVENEEQAAFLRAIGVPLAQGFLFAPGLRPAAAARWTQADSRR